MTFTLPPPKQAVTPASAIPRPRIDPAFKYSAGFEGVPDNLDLQINRALTSTSSASTILQAYPDLIHSEYSAPGLNEGDPAVALAVFESTNSIAEDRPVLYYVHGGGQVSGNRYFGVDQAIALFGNIDAVYVSVEYRLAPEHRAPSAAYDCYAGLVYLAENADKLRIDPKKIVVYGLSGGASPAAAACIIARNRKFPSIKAQMLSIPMLDDRNDTLSAKQFHWGVVWTQGMNGEAWDHVLGPDHSGDATQLQSPARATDLSCVAPAFIDVGECDVFRDEAVAYASQIWKSGGSAELHVWPGSYHGACQLEAHVPVARAAIEAQKSYIKSLFGSV